MQHLKQKSKAVTALESCMCALFAGWCTLEAMRIRHFGAAGANWLDAGCHGCFWLIPNEQIIHRFKQGRKRLQIFSRPHLRTWLCRRPSADSADILSEGVCMCPSPVLFCRACLRASASCSGGGSIREKPNIVSPVRLFYLWQGSRRSEEYSQSKSHERHEVRRCRRCLLPLKTSEWNTDGQSS